MIITVGNTKGGVGKTTISVNLAVARALSGRDVWLIDGDRQGTAQTAISIRSEAGYAPGIACATYPDGSTLRSQVQQQASRFHDVVIDAGGRDSTALRAALVLSDVLLVPFQPRSYDVWALNDIAALVDATIGWRGIAANGKPYEFSQENALAWNSGSPGIVNQLLDFIADKPNFTKGWSKSLSGSGDGVFTSTPIQKAPRSAGMKRLSKSKKV